MQVFLKFFLIWQTDCGIIFTMANEEEVISEAMRLLGRRTSEKKKKTSARNGERTRFQAKPLSELVCTCGQCPDNPKTKCPRGRAIRRRQAAGLPLEPAAKTASSAASRA
jgi:hypothetical protein